VRQSGLFDNAAVQAAGLIPRIKAAMRTCVEASGLSREQVLDRMNGISIAAGVKLTSGNSKSLGLATFDKWLNANEREHIPGILALNVFCAAIETTQPLDTLLAMHGCEILTPDSRIERDYGRACLTEKKARKRKRQLEASF
jgi:hypothetical protein